MKMSLQNKKLPVIASNAMYVAKAFNHFTVPLEARKPMIMVFYQKMTKFVKTKTDLLSHLIFEDTFFNWYVTM